MNHHISSQVIKNEEENVLHSPMNGKKMFLRGCKWLAKNIRRLQEKHREESKSTSRLPEVRAEMYREIDKSMLEEIFKSFYDLRTNERQTKFICRHCLLYTSPSPRDEAASRMPSSA